MALNPVGLTSDLTTFFSNLPATEALCASDWSTHIQSYTTGIVPAVPGPVQVAAGLVFEAALTGMSAPGAGIAIFDVAFAGYASALALGMPVGPIHVPPVLLLSLTLAPVFVANNAPGITHAAAASSISAVIDLWFRTGTSNGVPWS